MKRVYEFDCDGCAPSDKEFQAAIDMVANDNCTVRLNYLPSKYHGWCNFVVRDGMTLEYCKGCIPTVFGI